MTFLPTGWEDTLSGVGRPQSLINEDVQRCDYFVLVLWDRWGTPPRAGAGPYSSGTEEEYHVARQCLADPDRPLRNIVVLFKGVSERQLSDPGGQLQKVLTFRRQIEAEKTLLYQTFDTEDECARVLRKHLAQWVRDHEIAKSATQIPAPSLEGDVPAALPSSYDSIEAMLADAEKLAIAGRFVDSEALFARAVVGSRSIESRLKYGRFLRRLNRLAHARATFESALEIATEEGDVARAAQALANLGVIARHQRDPKAAETYLRTALERIGAAEEHKALRAFIVANIAHAYLDQNELDKAEQDAARGARPTGNTRTRGRSCEFIRVTGCNPSSTPSLERG